MSDTIFEDENEKNAFKDMIEKRNKEARKIYDQGKQVNGCILDYDTCFGISNQDIYGQLQIVGREQIIFVAANMLVIKDLAKKTYQFINNKEYYKNITCICAEPNRIDRSKDKIKNKSQIQHQNQTSQLNQENQTIIIATGQSTDQEDKNCSVIVCGVNYLKMWEIVFQEKIFRESQYPLVTLKLEKENKFINMAWTSTSISQIPMLVILTDNNKILLLQNDSLKKQIDIDVTNLNIIEAQVQDINVNEKDNEDDYDGLNIAIQNIMKGKKGKEENQAKEKDKEKEQNNTIQNQMYNQQIKFKSLASKQNGFVLGGSLGVLCIYDIEKNFQIINKQSYEMKFSQKNDQTIFYVSSSLIKDDLMSIVSQDQNKQINFLLLNMGDIDNEESPIQHFFNAGFHTKKINCIDTSITKQIFATCSEDRTVKIWNYYESENLEKKGVISQQFKEEPLCLSLHPFGMFIAITFGTFFKIFAILNDQLYPLKTTSMQNCTIVRYSNGGNYLAVNEKFAIQIYDTIYYQVVQQLVGHQTLVRDIHISDNDILLTSTSIDGYVFLWNLIEKQDSEKNAYKHQETSIYNSIIYDTKALKDVSNVNSKDIEDTSLFVGCTNEKYLVLYKNTFKQDQDLIAEFPVTDCYVTKLIVSNTLKCIFMGTNNGKIRVSVWPLHESNLEYEQINPNSNQVKFKVPDYFEIQAHSSSICAMQISNDNQYLITGDVTGVVQMLKIKDAIFKGEQIDNRLNILQNLKPEDKSRIDQTNNDLFLAKISKIIQKNEQKYELSKQVVRLEQDKKFEIQNIDARYRKKVAQINSEFENTMNQDISIKDTFINKSTEEYNKLLKLYQQEEEKYANNIKNLEQQHKEKIEYEEQRNKDLELEIEDIKSGHKDRLQKLLDDHQEQLKKLKLQFYDKCQSVQVKYSNVIDSAKVFGNTFIKSLEKEEAEQEKEIEFKIKELKDEIAKVHKVNEDLRKKNEQYENEYTQLKKEDDSMQKEFDELFKKHNEIRLENLKNDEHILKSQHQLLERLQVIDSKEETCKSAKDEQINLENFRYMLDQKIKSLQSEKQNLLEKINSKEVNLKSMFNELIKESNQNETKYQKLKKLNAEIKVLENSIKKSEVEIYFNTNKLTTFQNKLANIMKSNESVTVIAKRLNDMLEMKDTDEEEKYRQKKVISNDDIQEIIKMKQEKPNEVNDELFKQGEWLKKKLHLIKETSGKLKVIRDDNINTILNQNTKLIEECNLLRGENERYRKEMKKIEKLLAEAIRKRTKLREKNKELNKNQQSPSQMRTLLAKYGENQDRLDVQQNQLANIRETMDQIKNIKGGDVKLPSLQNQNQPENEYEYEQDLQDDNALNMQQKDYEQQE
ncbi:WD40-repeat-containing domain [Pseudocohnilembus persalinus]|uniref:WD40-repeat-containing domain n=1 Tax=Pseudocohnilembus persalinus TaxID=266149 RepID=A0A0V0QEU2_PSEPJ|nr:WD40-repeat-containing domain [Pseudocohnilembus persalinus]|eukprot:KRX00640.1 WD40-repeat-containing domain [Pseudocohnilembus persalinus]